MAQPAKAQALALAQKLDILNVVGRTYGFTPPEIQVWSEEVARSTHRAHMPESARIAQCATALEAVWGKRHPQP